jgi:hypothetical protein
MSVPSVTAAETEGLSGAYRRPLPRRLVLELGAEPYPQTPANGTPWWTEVWGCTWPLGGGGPAGLGEDHEALGPPATNARAS